ncbi:uncharacterized protein LOC133923288 [Phragmites australis]|uniref:uncharacterized protein LOC133923288 n=1 Tax=Phragmites australis TaxID=29695 RepID=UPI002D771139|nr:uncharacterized protein LOC133923288 [Phragmites australis]
MQSEEVKARFGRCPYCRAMIYQDPNAVIYYCSRCRTPIRGKNPRPTDETEYALAQLEILSADTASVFSDEVEQSNPKPAWVVEDDDGQPPVPSRSTPYGNFKPSSFQGTGATSSSPYREFGSVRTGPRSNRDEQTEAERTSSPLHSRVAELRPSSRRTRRSMSGDVDVPNDGGSGTDSECDVPASAASYRRRASPLSSQELEAATVLSGFELPNIARSPLTDPAFQQRLLQALDNLRRVIAAVDQPRSMDGHRHAGMSGMSAACSDDSCDTSTVTRRSSRLMRRLESQLAQALPGERPRRDASTSSSSSSSASNSRRGGLRARTHHCRPVLGGTPFVICDKCSEILQLPTALLLGRVARLQCGGCSEALALTLPASGSSGRPKKIFSAPQPAVCGAEDTENYALARGRLSGEQPGPLHRVLGYSSVSSVLRSRRYGEYS